jgi:hypothetical protein
MKFSSQGSGGFSEEGKPCFIHFLFSQIQSSSFVTDFTTAINTRIKRIKIITFFNIFFIIK